MRWLVVNVNAAGDVLTDLFSDQTGGTRRMRNLQRNFLRLIIDVRIGFPAEYAPGIIVK